MHENHDLVQLRQRYERFAREEAHGVSPRYEEFAMAVAQNSDVCEFLLSLPIEKQQPNLLFGAFRTHCGDVFVSSDFCELLLSNKENIQATMLLRSTQTNEPARCATLLPVLSQLPQPISLIEVGASAGLCLYPDRYQYRYGPHQLRPDRMTLEAPLFDCELSANTPVPDALPEVVWRSGIDLNPLNIECDDEVAWLENLIWPEQITRVKNFRRAIAIARQDPPSLQRGDLLSKLSTVVNQAPKSSTVVVFHSAVLAYVSDLSEREHFAETVQSLDVTWVSNEHPAVFPDIAARTPGPAPKDRFLLAIDGNPIAWTGPHGQSIDWIGSEEI